MAVSTGRGVAHRTWQTVGAASIGSALEWFDLLIVDGCLNPREAGARYLTA
jgi:hypothetical protein